MKMKQVNISMTVCALGFVFMIGCEADSSDGLSGEGEACDKTADCHGDLRCMDNFCVSSGDGDADSDGDADGDTDGDTDEGSEGCGKDPEDISQALDIGGETRTFELYIPSDYDPSRAYPLIFGLHGGGGTGPGFQSYCGLDEEVGSDAVVVYPDALPEDGFGDTVWILNPEGDDFVFFDDLLAHLKTNLCIDETRLFSTGWSMGGYMTNSLGCYRADVLTAIASVSGGVPGDKPPAPAYPDCDGRIATWIAHGASDSIIPLSEGDEMRDIFLENNGCGQTPSPTDPDPCVAYDGCDTPMHWCEFGGDHEWPDFAAAGIWQFFSDQ
jgi:polyhydroxybutyrate depolymerase